MAKLNLTEITKIYAFDTFNCVIVGILACKIWENFGGQPDYLFIIGSIWLTMVGLPLLLGLIKHKSQQTKVATNKNVLMKGGHDG